MENASTYFSGKARVDGKLLEVDEVGTLKLPSGRIVARDFLASSELGPFARKVRPGEYPVLVARVEGTRNNALAQVRFGDGTVVTWELAQRGDDDDDEAGYSVDTGVGGFADKKTCSALKEQLEEDEEYVEQLVDASDDADEPWVMFEVDEDANIALFNSGSGDGTYSSYWGLDGKGNPVCLVTDFEIIPDLAW